MSTEYAIVDDASGEAYDLGRGPWYEWSEGRAHTYDHRIGPPKTRKDVEALLTYWQEGWVLGPQPRWSVVLADAIESFLADRPHARVVNDGGDHAWGSPNEALDEVIRASGVRVYRQVGSRYDHEPLIERSSRA